MRYIIENNSIFRLFDTVVYITQCIIHVASNVL